MKLYWAPQSRSIRALWMLEEAGCAYERELVDIRKGAQASVAYRAINPMMKVPALTDGEAKLAESGAICAYVADKETAAGLAPRIGDPARGRYLHYLFFSPGCVEPAYTQKMAGLELASSTAGWGSYERVLDVLEEALAPGPWLLGERFSAADVMIGSDLHFGVRIVNLVEPRPVFDAYIDRCLARPALARAQAIEAAAM